MQVGQLMAGVGIGLGLAAGSIGGWATFQRWQAEAVQPIQSMQSVANQSANQPVNQSALSQPALMTQAVQTAPAGAALTQAENDYLYDLSLALQSAEQRRDTEAAKLMIGRQVAGWLQQGSDYWQVRRQFDQTYQTVLAGDYVHNRDVYIKFATERFAPAFVATLHPPQAPQVVVKTRTEYVEVPGKTKVIRDVIHVPEPYPEPYPVPIPVPIPHHPKPPHPQPEPVPLPTPIPDDEAQVPDHPEDIPDQPDLEDPPAAEQPDETEQATEPLPESIEIGAEPSPESNGESISESNEEGTY